jgi:putative transposase
VVVRQCELLNLSRFSVYYLPQAVSESDLALMRRIDALHLEHPFAGTRMLHDFLRLEGIAVGRRRVSTLMKKMGIEALYRCPNTSRKTRCSPTCCAAWTLLRQITCGPWTWSFKCRKYLDGIKTEE